MVDTLINQIPWLLLTYIDNTIHKIKGKTHIWNVQIRKRKKNQQACYIKEKARCNWSSRRKMKRMRTKMWDLLLRLFTHGHGLLIAFALWQRQIAFEFALIVLLWQGYATTFLFEVNLSKVCKLNSFVMG